jgi:HD superfamily phosphohydrolase YqeK
MSPLDRLFYVADFSSSDRAFPAARAVRRTALKDIDMAFRAALRWKLQFTLEAGGALHPLSIGLWNRWRRP